MKCGQVENPQEIDFIIPPDHLDNKRILGSSKTNGFAAYVGGAKWNKAGPKEFLSKGTKDELGYYSTQFNSIELNATFFRHFSAEQFAKWKETTPDGFKFFPKLE